MSTKQIAVEYIGTKARKEDNIAGSGAVWLGQGDVQLVDANTWGKLAIHTGVWRKVDEQLTGSQKPLSLSDIEANSVTTPKATTGAAEDDSAPEGMSVEQVSQAFDTVAKAIADATREDETPLPSAADAKPAAAPVARKTAGKAKATTGAAEGSGQ